MDDQIFDKAPEFDKIHEVDLKKTMESSYIDYAMRTYRGMYNMDNYEDRKQMTMKMSCGLMS